MVISSNEIKIGVLALQGAFDLHVKSLEKINEKNDFDFRFKPVLVKRPRDLEALSGIVIPGGESTVLNKLLESSGLREPLIELIEQGLVVLGTCAGLIVLANDFKVLDCQVQRNAYGTQTDSFTAEVDFVEKGKGCEVYFIRAPKITGLGKHVIPIAKLGDDVVGVKQENVIGLTFHPEVGENLTFHEFFVEIVGERLALQT